MKLAKTIEEYFESKKEWIDSLEVLREIFQNTELDETLKWGMPTYVLGGKNVAGFSAFKSHVAIWFHQGVFLKDPAGKLINAQEGITKAQRQWRFSSADEVSDNRVLIMAYLEEAIHNQKAGKEIKPDKNKPIALAPEMEAALGKDPSLKDSFNALSPGKQREYAAYISEAKREETRLKRLEKIVPMIREGIGLNDKYR